MLAKQIENLHPPELSQHARTVCIYDIYDLNDIFFFFQIFNSKFMVEHQIYIQVSSLDNTIAFIHNIDSNSISLSGRLQSISEIVSLLPIRHFHCAVITMYTIFRFSDIIQTLSDDMVIGQGCIKCCLLLFIGEGFFTEDSDVP